MDIETLRRVEKQRAELENNIANLRKSLRHWQTLEIDYEGLKEEFQILDKDASQDECLQVAKDFHPELVDDKELQSLLEDKGRSYKRPPQLVEVLSKRIDYVARNVSTIRKQLSDAEKKRNALLLAQGPDHQDDAGLPLSEITEELDEEGRVISSRVQAPGGDAPGLLEVLRKAGVSDIKDGEELPVQETKNENKNNSPETIGHEPGNVIPSARSQADQTQIHHDVDPTECENPSEEDEPTTNEKLGPMNPNDDEEDAASRQEMLQYGLGEVGAIVAELDLEESGDMSYDEDDEDDYLSDYDENADLYTDESEDERGATKNPVISEHYKRQMESLSKKHGITDLQNLGPEPVLPDDVKEQLDRPSAAEAARQAALARENANKSSLKLKDAEDQSGDEPRKKKKKVAFATSLDIAQEKLPQSPSAATPKLSEPAANPVGETVIERSAGEAGKTTAPPSTQPSIPQKISEFKAARSAAPPTPMFPPKMEFPSSSASKPTPEGPPRRTISTTLVERPASQITAPADPTDFDEELHRREVAIEYQKMRNRKIHEQGGYVKGGEEDNYGEEIAPAVVLDENTGKPRKVSRFKAARIKS